MGQLKVSSADQKRAVANRNKKRRRFSPERVPDKLPLSKLLRSGGRLTRNCASAIFSMENKDVSPMTEAAAVPSGH